MIVLLNVTLPTLIPVVLLCRLHASLHLFRSSSLPFTWNINPQQFPHYNGIHMHEYLLPDMNQSYIYFSETTLWPRYNKGLNFGKMIIREIGYCSHCGQPQ